MLSPSKAKRAAACPARGRLPLSFSVLTLVATAIGTAGCLPTAMTLGGADPADPTARVAPVQYRAITAPYSSLRPAAPTSWRERNDAVAPRSESDR
ncbi:hypothetical protein [Bradyrhizobium sp. STM 3843]|uniref:hypothetical protein n=1 Tax=Bradyrhizobium sp. STM 3843 TaxID=551947 RepID=UPI0005667558|nr:hypothetical protein [Bradyrhizobium sp. STM 3843]